MIDNIPVPEELADDVCRIAHSYFHPDFKITLDHLPGKPGYRMVTFKPATQVMSATVYNAMSWAVKSFVNGYVMGRQNYP